MSTSLSRVKSLLFPPVTSKTIFLYAFVVRLALVLFGRVQDAHPAFFSGVRYTDVDYDVFTDAARYVCNNQSPYERNTYRYTPLLAWMLTPNVFWFAEFGKVLFSLCDVYCGKLVHEILRKRKCSESFTIQMTALYLFNPLTMAISTRGSCDAVANALVLFSLKSLMFGTILNSAVSFGLAVHFRMYPVIYIVPLIVALDVQYHVNWNYYGGGSGAKLERSGCKSKRERLPSSGVGDDQELQQQQQQQQNKVAAKNNSDRQSMAIETKETRRLRRARALASKSAFGANGLFNIARLLFAGISFTAFAFSTFACYWKYGRAYLNEAILYHFSRKDPRHNFAPNFFSVYLDTAIEDAESDFGAYILSRSLTKAYALASKITQYGLTVLIGIAFAYDLPFAMFAQTFAFVAFNSVITSQYFAWWCALLPISLATFDYSNRDSAARVMSATITWIVSKLVWLKNAHALEMSGEENGHFNAWAASCGFLFASANALRALVSEQRTKRVFVRGKVYTLEKEPRVGGGEDHHHHDHQSFNAGFGGTTAPEGSIYT